MSMQFDVNNNIVKLCATGMELEGQGKKEEALKLFQQAWHQAADDLEKFTAAHYVARHQDTIADKLKWDEMALQFALNISDGNVKAVLPSLYLNIAKCYEDLNDAHNARNNYRLAQSFASKLPDDGYGNMIKSGIVNGLKRMNNTRMENYTVTIAFTNVSPAQVFNALTSGIRYWWTEMFEGQADELHANFTVRFGANVFKTMRVAGLEQHSKVTWLVEDSLINIPELQNQQEWIDTSICWTIISENGHTVLRLEHIGLTPQIECYGICSTGWEQFVGSLKAYLEQGKGKPFSVGAI